MEGIYGGVAPFAVHQYWTKLTPSGEGDGGGALARLLDGCPAEALAILPPGVVAGSDAWREAVCGREEEEGGEGVVVVSAAWVGEDEEGVCSSSGDGGGGVGDREEV